jgi:hypothetical protein
MVCVLFELIDICIVGEDIILDIIHGDILGAQIQHMLIKFDID